MSRHVPVYDSPWPAPGHCSGCWWQGDYVPWQQAVDADHLGFDEPPRSPQYAVEGEYLVVYLDPSCKGCSGIASPAHIPGCGVEPVDKIETILDDLRAIDRVRRFLPWLEQHAEAPKSQHHFDYAVVSRAERRSIAGMLRGVIEGTWWPTHADPLHPAAEYIRQFFAHADDIEDKAKGIDLELDPLIAKRLRGVVPCCRMHLPDTLCLLPEGHE